MTMFVAPKNANVEMWEGARTGLDAAKEVFGADEVLLLLPGKNGDVSTLYKCGH